MQKYHRWISFIFALAFLILVQQFPYERPVFRIFILALAAFLICLYLYSRWFLKKVGAYNFWTALGPALFYLSSAAIFSVVQTSFLKGAFLLLTLAAGSFLTAFLNTYLENLFLLQALLTAFEFFTAVFGLNFYFPKFYPLFLFGIFFAAFFSSRGFLEFAPNPPLQKNLVAAVLALLCCELFWAMNFLPLHFGSLALLLFNFFYFCLVVSYQYLFHVLSPKKIQFHFAVILFTSGLVLAATPWAAIS